MSQNYTQFSHTQCTRLHIVGVAGTPCLHGASAEIVFSKMVATSNANIGLQSELFLTKFNLFDHRAIWPGMSYCLHYCYLLSMACCSPVVAVKQYSPIPGINWCGPYAFMSRWIQRSEKWKWVDQHTDKCWSRSAWPLILWKFENVERWCNSFTMFNLLSFFMFINLISVRMARGESCTYHTESYCSF